jgi:hypothetical protein
MGSIQTTSSEYLRYKKRSCPVFAPTCTTPVTCLRNRLGLLPKTFLISRRSD